jgi:plasmid maintenance system antidote protein VapI
MNFHQIEIDRLHYEEKLSINEIANILNLNETTIKTIINKKQLHVEIIKGTSSRDSEYRQKIREKLQGENCYKAKLTDNAVKKIRGEYELLLEFGIPKIEAQYKLAKKYGVKRPTITNVVKNQTWKHI